MSVSALEVVSTTTGIFLSSGSALISRSTSRPSFLNMPKKDGREVLREIKADPELRKIPVVVLTTSKADTDIGRIYELGANSFISKPVSFDSLVEVMKTLGRYWFEIVELPVQKP